MGYSRATEILEELAFAGPSATQAIVERPKQLLLQSDNTQNDDAC